MPHDVFEQDTTSGGVTTFNTRSGAVTLSKTDVTGTGLAAADVSADASGAAAAAQAAAIAASARALTPTAVKTSAYAAAAGDFVPVDASGGTLTVTLPTAPADKTRLGVKVVIQAAVPNNVTIAAGGSDVFNKASGSTSLTLAALNQGVLLQYKSTGAIWYVSTADTPLSQPSGAAKLGTDGNVGGSGGSALAAAAALVPANNLSDLGSASTARTSLGLGTVATHAATEFPLVSNNLSDVTAATARTNLGLGTAATQASTVFAQTANNLSDVTAATARTNLGLGSGALLTSGTAVVSGDKTGINSSNTGTTLQSITDLAVAIGASATEIWLLKWWILSTATNNAMDIKFGLSVPTACTVKWGPISAQVGGWENLSTANSAAAAIPTEVSTISMGGGNLMNGNQLVAIVFGGGNAGNVVLQYAQNTSDASNLVLNKGSCVEYKRLQT